MPLEVVHVLPVPRGHAVLMGCEGRGFMGTSGDYGREGAVSDCGAAYASGMWCVC